MSRQTGDAEGTLNLGRQSSLLGEADLQGRGSSACDRRDEGEWRQMGCRVCLGRPIEPARSDPHGRGGPAGGLEPGHQGPGRGRTEKT